GQIKQGQLADLAVLSRDYFSVAEDEIPDITSVLTLLGGKPVHGDEEFKDIAPPLPSAMPDWSPVRSFGGHHRPAQSARTQAALFAASGAGAGACSVHARACATLRPGDSTFLDDLACSCWAF